MTPSTKVLIVDDDCVLLERIAEQVMDFGYITFSAQSGSQAIAKYREVSDISIVIVDYEMPGMKGMELARKLQDCDPSRCLYVLVLTAHFIPFEEFPVGIVKDYLKKPCEPARLEEGLAEAVRFLRECATLQPEFLRQGIIGSEGLLAHLQHNLKKIAQSEFPVLIRGETGTGKELVANAIHDWSCRRERCFVPVHCAAFATHVLESEIFGHEMGAFTGAIKKRRGRFDYANKGTLFLDEIGDISLETQIKLLRVLQKGTFTPVGGDVETKVDVRIVAATNQAIEDLIDARRFREDFFHRISAFEVFIPALRERRQDIPDLARGFLAQTAAKLGQDRKTISDQAMEVLVNYSWPGNIRELQNVIRRVVVLSDSDKIGASDLSDLAGPKRNSRPAGGTYEEQVDRFQRNLIQDALRQAGGVKSKAARALGMKAGTLGYQIERLGIQGVVGAEAAQSE